jgi:hypothetical protein
MEEKLNIFLNRIVSISFFHPPPLDLQLLEAHESALHGLALTASGSKLASASVKGTVIRVWDVSSGTCLQEFRRGVERATITCLAWSWDDRWLACTSDKGTAHVFQVGEGEQGSNSSGSRGMQAAAAAKSASFTQRLLSSVIQTVEGDAKKSVCQVRGVPHPQACAFVADASNLLAVAGWDADGNGVLLLSEFEPGREPRRVGYHVVCPGAVVRDASDEARRRRRLRGWTPEIPQTPEGGRLYIGERLEVLEKNMEQIHFEEKDEFVEVLTAKRPPETDQGRSDSRDEWKVVASSVPGGADMSNENRGAALMVGGGGDEGGESSQNTADEARSGNLDHSTVAGDSVRTEPLDDDVLVDPSNGSSSSEHHQHQ